MSNDPSLGAEDVVAAEAGVVEPVAAAPTAPEPAAAEVVPAAPPAGSRGADGPGADGPASNGPASDGPASDGPASDGPASNGPASDGPASDGPSADVPTSDVPASDGPAADPAVVEPALADSVPTDPAPTDPVATTYIPDEAALRLAEAMVFASAGPVTARALSQVLPENADADAVIAALRARYVGRGVELADAGGGVMFRTAEDLAPRLRKVVQIPRRLPRVAMETLAIIAYHQPVTRAEIEEIRGTSLSQQTLEALMEANLILLKGRRETPGRPAIWGTTPEFLAQFGLQTLRDLPRREDLLLELPIPTAAAAEAAGDVAAAGGAGATSAAELSDDVAVGAEVVAGRDDQPSGSDG